MLNVTETQEKVKSQSRLAALLDDIARRGFDRGLVERLLEGYVYSRYQYTDSRGNNHYLIHVPRPDLGRPCELQFIEGADGNTIGCATCASDQAGGRYMPFLAQCPAVGAGMVFWVMNRKAVEPAPAQVKEFSMAEIIAADLRAEYGELGGRIERALELVRAGRIEFPEYQTGISLATNRYICECPDAQYRAPHLKATGMACKHCLAQYIARKVGEENDRVATRKLADRQESRRARETALPASVDRSGSIEDYLGYEPVEYAHYQNDGLTVAEQKAQARASLPGVDAVNRKARRPNFNNPNRYR